MLKKIDNYTFVCESRNTRSGFAHDCTLYDGDFKIASATCYYLNRTWESYRFQSVMNKAVRTAIDDLEKRYLLGFKNKNGYSKMTEKRKADFEKFLNTKENYKRLKNLYLVL